MRRPIALALDALMVLVFAGLGRSAHNEPSSALALLSTAWPFVVGLAVGWAISIGLQRIHRFHNLNSTSLRIGVVIWISTVLLGMALRAVSGAGTAAPFVIVAFVVLGLGILGWRALYLGYSHWRTRNDSTISSSM